MTERSLYSQVRKRDANASATAAAAMASTGFQNTQQLFNKERNFSPQATSNFGGFNQNSDQVMQQSQYRQQNLLDNADNPFFQIDVRNFDQHNQGQTGSIQKEPLKIPSINPNRNHYENKKASRSKSGSKTNKNSIHQIQNSIMSNSINGNSLQISGNNPQMIKPHQQSDAAKIILNEYLNQHSELLQSINNTNNLQKLSHYIRDGVKSSTGYNANRKDENNNSSRLNYTNDLSASQNQTNMSNTMNGLNRNSNLDSNQMNSNSNRRTPYQLNDTQGFDQQNGNNQFQGSKKYANAGSFFTRKNQQTNNYLQPNEQSFNNTIPLRRGDSGLTSDDMSTQQGLIGISQTVGIPIKNQQKNGNNLQQNKSVKLRSFTPNLRQYKTGGGGQVNSSLTHRGNLGSSEKGRDDVEQQRMLPNFRSNTNSRENLSASKYKFKQIPSANKGINSNSNYNNNISIAPINTQPNQQYLATDPLSTQEAAFRTENDIYTQPLNDKQLYYIMNTNPDQIPSTQRNKKSNSMHTNTQNIQSTSANKLNDDKDNSSQSSLLNVQNNQNNLNQNKNISSPTNSNGNLNSRPRSKQSGQRTQLKQKQDEKMEQIKQIYLKGEKRSRSSGRGSKLHDIPEAGYNQSGNYMTDSQKSIPKQRNNHPFYVQQISHQQEEFGEEVEEIDVTEMFKKQSKLQQMDNNHNLQFQQIKMDKNNSLSKQNKRYQNKDLEDSDLEGGNSRLRQSNIPPRMSQQSTNTQNDALGTTGVSVTGYSLNHLINSDGNTTQQKTIRLDDINDSFHNEVHPKRNNESAQSERNQTSQSKNSSSIYAKVIQKITSNNSGKISNNSKINNNSNLNNNSQNDNNDQKLGSNLINSSNMNYSQSGFRRSASSFAKQKQGVDDQGSSNKNNSYHPQKQSDYNQNFKAQDENRGSFSANPSVQNLRNASDINQLQQNNQNNQPQQQRSNSKSQIRKRTISQNQTSGSAKKPQIISNQSSSDQSESNQKNEGGNTSKREDIQNSQNKQNVGQSNLLSSSKKDNKSKLEGKENDLLHKNDSEKKQKSNNDEQQDKSNAVTKSNINNNKNHSDTAKQQKIQSKDPQQNTSTKSQQQNKDNQNPLDPNLLEKSQKNKSNLTQQKSLKDIQNKKESGNENNVSNKPPMQPILIVTSSSKVQDQQGNTQLLVSQDPNNKTNNNDIKSDTKLNQQNSNNLLKPQNSDSSNSNNLQKLGDKITLSQLKQDKSIFIESDTTGNNKGQQNKDNKEVSLDQSQQKNNQSFNQSNQDPKKDNQNKNSLDKLNQSKQMSDGQEGNNNQCKINEQKTNSKKEEYPERSQDMINQSDNIINKKSGISNKSTKENLKSSIQPNQQDIINISQQSSHNQSKQSEILNKLKKSEQNKNDISNLKEQDNNNQKLDDSSQNNKNQSNDDRNNSNISSKNKPNKEESEKIVQNRQKQNSNIEDKKQQDHQNSSSNKIQPSNEKINNSQNQIMGNNLKDSTSRIQPIEKSNQMEANEISQNKSSSNKSSQDSSQRIQSKDKSNIQNQSNTENNSKDDKNNNKQNANSELNLSKKQNDSENNGLKQDKSCQLNSSEDKKINNSSRINSQGSEIKSSIKDSIIQKKDGQQNSIIKNKDKLEDSNHAIQSGKNNSQKSINKNEGNSNINESQGQQQSNHDQSLLQSKNSQNIQKLSEEDLQNRSQISNKNKSQSKLNQTNIDNISSVSKKNVQKDQEGSLLKDENANQQQQQGMPQIEKQGQDNQPQIDQTSKIINQTDGKADGVVIREIREQNGNELRIITEARIFIQNENNDQQGGKRRRKQNKNQEVESDDSKEEEEEDQEDSNKSRLKKGKKKEKERLNKSKEKKNRSLNKMESQIDSDNELDNDEDNQDGIKRKRKTKVDEKQFLEDQMNLINNQTQGQIRDKPSKRGSQNSRLRDDISKIGSELKSLKDDQSGFNTPNRNPADISNFIKAQDTSNILLNEEIQRDNNQTYDDSIADQKSILAQLQSNHGSLKNLNPMNQPLNQQDKQQPDNSIHLNYQDELLNELNTEDKQKKDNPNTNNKSDESEKQETPPSKQDQNQNNNNQTTPQSKKPSSKYKEILNKNLVQVQRYPIKETEGEESLHSLHNDTSDELEQIVKIKILHDQHTRNTHSSYDSLRQINKKGDGSQKNIEFEEMDKFKMNNLTPEEILDMHIQQNRKKIRKINRRPHIIKQDMDKLIENAIIFDIKCRIPKNIDFIEEIKTDPRHGELAFGRESYLLDSAPKVRYFRGYDQEMMRPCAMVQYAIDQYCDPQIVKEWHLMQHFQYNAQIEENRFLNLQMNTQKNNTDNTENGATRKNFHYGNNAEVSTSYNVFMNPTLLLMDSPLVYEYRHFEYTFFLEIEDFYPIDQILLNRFKESKIYEEKELLFIFTSLIECVLGFRAKNICLGNIQIEHVAFCPASNSYKFFNLTKAQVFEESNKEKRYNIYYPKTYLAPELAEIDGESDVGQLFNIFAADLYALGITLLCFKYHMINNNRTFNFIQNRIEMCKNSMQLSGIVINYLLEEDPKKRVQNLKYIQKELYQYLKEIYENSKLGNKEIVSPPPPSSPRNRQKSDNDNPLNVQQGQKLNPEDFKNEKIVAVNAPQKKLIQEDFEESQGGNDEDVWNDSSLACTAWNSQNNKSFMRRIDAPDYELEVNWAEGKSINNQKLNPPSIKKIAKQIHDRIQSAQDIARMYKYSFQWEKASNQYINNLEIMKQQSNKVSDSEILRTVNQIWQCLYYNNELDDSLHYNEVYFNNIHTLYMHDEVQMAYDHLLSGKLKWILNHKVDSSQDFDIALMCTEQYPLDKAKILILLGDFFAEDSEISAEQYYKDALEILQAIILNPKDVMRSSASNPLKQKRDSAATVQTTEGDYDQDDIFEREEYLVMKLKERTMHQLAVIEDIQMSELREKLVFLEENSAKLSTIEKAKIQLDVANQYCHQFLKYNEADYYYQEALNSLNTKQTANKVQNKSTNEVNKSSSAQKMATSSSREKRMKKATQPSQDKEGQSSQQLKTNSSSTSSSASILSQNIKELIYDIQKFRIINFLKMNNEEEAKTMIQQIVIDNTPENGIKNIDNILQLAIILEENLFHEHCLELYNRCYALATVQLGSKNEFTIKLKDKINKL